MSSECRLGGADQAQSDDDGGVQAADAGKLTAMSTFSRIPLNYYVGQEHILEDKYAEIPPQIGNGVEISDKYYRVTDVWTASVHNPLSERTASVFLEEVEPPAGLH